MKLKNVMFLMSAMLVFTLTSFSQNLATLDAKYGFREAKFEMPFDSFKNLVEVESQVYKSSTENLKLGDYDLKLIAYEFYDEQLSTITIKTEGYSNSRGVLKILQTAYGKGYQSNEYIERYFWFGEKVTMAYDQNSITDDATIIIWSNKIEGLKKANENNSNSKAASQL